MDQELHPAASPIRAQAAPIYTQPELHQRLRDEILAADRGGAPGEWSARKAQLLTQEYRQAGGGYTFAKRSPGQSWPDAATSPEAESDDLSPARPQRGWTELRSGRRPAAEASDN